MAKIKIPPEKVEELKQKHNLTDEAIKDFADSLEVETDEVATATTPNPDPEESSFIDLNKALSSGEISFTQYLMWSDLQERKAESRRQARLDQEKLDLQREERRPQTPTWAEGLIAKVNNLEAKVSSTTTTTTKPEDPLLKVYEERSKDLMSRLEKQDEKHEKLLDELKEDRDKAKDEATKALIEKNMGEVQVKMDAFQDLLEKYNQTTKDPIEFLAEAKRKAAELGIEFNFGGGNSTAKSREELQVKTADAVINEIRAATKEGREFLKEFGDTVILPRMKVETGLTKTSPMTGAERTKYYADLGIKA